MINDKSKRLSFHSGHAIVFGWPSTGGILIKTVSAVEIDWLKLSHFEESKRSFDESKEDAFCSQLRQVGARWYWSESGFLYRDDLRDYEAFCAGYRSMQLLRDIEVAFPLSNPATETSATASAANGAWILRVSLEKAEAKRQRCFLNLALDMGERCQVIQKLGGRFFQNADEVPALMSCAEDEEEAELECLQAETETGHCRGFMG